MYRELCTKLNSLADCVFDDGLHPPLSLHETKRRLQLLLLLTAALMVPISTVAGQTIAADFVSFQRTLPITNLAAPASVAFDKHGNLFVADMTLNSIFEYSPHAISAGIPVASVNQPMGIAVDANGVMYVTSGQSVYLLSPKAGGGYNAPTLIATLTDPYGIAVDQYGDLFVADPGVANPGTQAVYELSPNGSGYTQSQLGCCWQKPVGVAVDSAGDIYVADENQPFIIEEFLYGGYYQEETLGNGDFGAPTGVAVDALGNVYVTDNQNLVEYKLQPAIGNSNPYVESTIAVNWVNPWGAAVDARGNLYVADQSQKAIIEMSNDFGSLAVGTANSGNTQVAANFRFVRGVTLGGVAVRTEGNSNGDFFNAGGGSCIAGQAYTPSSPLCSVNIGFKPRAPGVRTGSVALTDSLGNLISTTGFFSGVGKGPRAAILPGSWNTIASSVQQANAATGVVLDGNGYIYTVANSDVFQSKDGGTTWIEVYDGAMHSASGAVVDGSGNVFIATTDGYIFESVPQPNGTFVTISNPVATEGYTIQSIAIDKKGNLYVVDTSEGELEEEVASYATDTQVTYTQVFIGDFFNFDPFCLSGLGCELTGVAVDSSGIVYVTDATVGAVYGNIPGPSGTFTPYEAVRGLDSPTGIITDPAGNLYITDSGVDTGVPTIYQAQLSRSTPGSFTLFPVVSTNAADPLAGLAMDDAGNLYVTDDQSPGNVYQINVTGGTLNFATTPVGVESTDSPKAALIANTGNQSLTISVPDSGQNPSSSPSYSIGSSAVIYPGYAPAIADCGIVLPGGAGVELAADSECALPISFVPDVAGSINGQVVVTDNSLNSVAQQVITLNGNGLVAATTTSISSSLDPAIYGQEVTLIAEVKQASGIDIPAGTVQFYLNGTALGAPQELTDGAATITSSTLPVGSLAINAIYTPANGAFTGSTSSTLTETVSVDVPSITLTSSSTASIYGQSLTFNALVEQAQGQAAPPGSVQFLANGTAISAPMVLANNGATLTTSALAAGSYTISAVYTSTSPDFMSGSAKLSQVVNKVSPVMTLNVSANHVFATNPVSVVAVVSGYATNAGTVTIYDGTTALWTGVPGVNGVSLDLPNLAVGTHSLTAGYSGNANAYEAHSAAVVETVEDFALAVATSPAKPPIPGGSAVYTFTVTPVGPLTTFPAAINLTATGAPPQSTITISPSVVAAGSGTTTVTMTVRVSPGMVELEREARPGINGTKASIIALGFVLMPFAVRMRRAARGFTRLIGVMIFAIVSLAAISVVSGCGMNFTPAYDLTVTATSGSLSHSAGVAMQVQE